MSILVKWKEDGDYLKEFTASKDATWTKRQRDAIRFESNAASKAIIRSQGARTWLIKPALVTFVRLVPKTPPTG